jgi:hypothetical protein
LSGAFAVNSAVLTAAALVLAVSPATVSFPIAIAEAVVLAAWLIAALGVNLTLLRRVGASTVDVTTSAAAATGGSLPISVQHDGMDAAGRRLLVCWTDPQHSSAEDAREWASTELRRVLDAERAAAARLARLRAASHRYGTSGDWLLELDVAADDDAETWLESPAWTAWLGDLRALGLRPGVMVADRAQILRAEVQ